MLYTGGVEEEAGKRAGLRHQAMGEFLFPEEWRKMRIWTSSRKEAQIIIHRTLSLCTRSEVLMLSSTNRWATDDPLHWSVEKNPSLA